MERKSVCDRENNALDSDLYIKDEDLERETHARV